MHVVLEEGEPRLAAVVLGLVGDHCLLHFVDYVTRLVLHHPLRDPAWSCRFPDRQTCMLGVVVPYCWKGEGEGVGRDGRLKVGPLVAALYVTHPQRHSRRRAFRSKLGYSKTHSNLLRTWTLLSWLAMDCQVVVVFSI